MSECAVVRVVSVVSVVWSGVVSECVSKCVVWCSVIAIADVHAGKCSSEGVRECMVWYVMAV